MNGWEDFLRTRNNEKITLFFVSRNKTKSVLETFRLQYIIECTVNFGTGVIGAAQLNIALCCP